MMVFSSLVVLQQFIDKYSDSMTDNVVCVCSELRDVSFPTTTDSLMLSVHLHSKSVLFLTTYNSVYKIDKALRRSNIALDLAVFDEAHNAHTPERDFLYASDIDSQYTHRLYMTATPREEMFDPANANIYGDQETNWYTFSYTDALEADPPFVKGLRVRIVVGGTQHDVVHSNEFFDIVSIVREMSYRRENGLPLRRIKVYHKRAHDGTADAYTKRSAEHFANSTLWNDALDYLHDRREAQGLSSDDLDIRNIDGKMSDAQQAGTLDWFNETPTEEKDETIRVLLSCQLLREGVTLERVDLTVFADGKGSPRDIVQSGLRGAKIDPTNPEALLDILLLAQTDTKRIRVEDAHDKIKQALGNFATIATVLNALMEADPAVRDALIAAASQQHQAVLSEGHSDGNSTSSERTRCSMVISPELVQFGWHEQELLVSHLMHSVAIKAR